MYMNIKWYEHITEEEKWPAECGAEVKTLKVEVLQPCVENGREEAPKAGVVMDS